MRTRPTALGLILLTAPLAALPGPQEQRARALTPAGAAETRAVIELPELGREVVDVRRVTADGRVLRHGEDANGATVDVDALRRTDHALGHARRGQMSPRLFERIASAGPDERVEVALWLRDAGGGDATREELLAELGAVEPELVSDAVKAARRTALERGDERNASRVSALAATVRDLGGDVLVEGLGWPLVIAELPAARVAAVAANPLVDEAYLSQPTWKAEGDSAQGTMRTYNVHDQGLVADGSVRVLVHEFSHVDANNPYLPPIVELNDGPSSPHATGVAGNIANDHPIYRAAAFGLPELYSVAGAGDVDAPPNWQLAIQAGVDLSNCSWWNDSKGAIVFLDRFYDYTIRNFSVMMFKSNGNQGLSGAPFGTTPGQGYNMISTGTFSDQDDVAWPGDAMSASSSWQNPVNGHEKPELVAPGSCVTTTGFVLGLQPCFGGTSSASPMVCALGAVLASANNTLLTKMVTLKAILMASAWQNVEGAAPLSDRDGAGGIHATAAHAVLRDRQWVYKEVDANDFPGGQLDVPMKLVAGDETRVIAVWFSNPDSAYTTDVLEMDVDLVVLDPGGAVVASSASALDPFELAAFVPASSGEYTLRLVLQRFDGVTEPLGLAWSSRSDSATAEILMTGQPAVGETPVLNFRERYVGAGQPFLAWASFTPLPGWPLPGGWTLPVAFDQLSAQVLSLPGFQGILGPDGTARTSLPIQDSPLLAGLEFHLGLVVLDGIGLPITVGSVAPTLSVTVLP